MAGTEEDSPAFKVGFSVNDTVLVKGYLDEEFRIIALPSDRLDDKEYTLQNIKTSELISANESELYFKPNSPEAAYDPNQSPRAQYGPSTPDYPFKTPSPNSKESVDSFYDYGFVDFTGPPPEFYRDSDPEYYATKMEEKYGKDWKELIAKLDEKYPNKKYMPRDEYVHFMMRMN